MVSGEWIVDLFSFVSLVVQDFVFLHVPRGESSFRPVSPISRMPPVMRDGNDTNFVADDLIDERVRESPQDDPANVLRNRDTRERHSGSEYEGVLNLGHQA